MIEALYVHNLDPVALSLGRLSVHWYGIAYLLGVVAAICLLKSWARSTVQPWVLPESKVMDFATYAMLFGVFLGGRLGYTLFYWIPDVGLEQAMANWTYPLQIWKGGMASHGGILGLIVFSYFYAKKHQISWLGLGDGLCWTAPIGLFLGRLANFINGELYGHVIPQGSSFKWGMKFPSELTESGSIKQAVEVLMDERVQPFLQENLVMQSQMFALVKQSRKSSELLAILAEYVPTRYPSQLIQALLEGLVLFLLLSAVRWWLRYKRNNTQGILVVGFFIGYPILRMLAEQFRVPDSALVWGLTKGQFYSVFMLLLAVFFALLIKQNSNAKVAK